MVRIKGVNSDYEYSTDEGKILEKHPDELYMKIFICPNDQPSAIDQRDKDKACCQGASDFCPVPKEQQNGHAAVELHQKKGISLQTDGAILQLNQNQECSLILESPQGQRVEIRATMEGFEFNACGAGASFKVDSEGNLDLAAANGKTLTLRGNVDIQGQIQGDLLKIIQATVDNAIKQHESTKKHG